MEFVEAGGTNRIESIECLSLFSLEGRNYPCERLWDTIVELFWE